MENSDSWGRDQAVRMMRTVFAAMEAAGDDLLDRCDVSRFDPRLRRARETARLLAGKAWGMAERRGVTLNDHSASGFYVACLAWALRRDGIHTPDNELDDLRLREVLHEVLP